MTTTTKPRDAGNVVMCIGILGISIGIAASVWYPIQRLTENLDLLIQNYNTKGNLYHLNW